MIYRGQIAGKEHRSSGGGTNQQCLPDDPEYDPRAANAQHSMPRATLLRSNGEKTNRRLPRVACATDQRVNQIMIPVKTCCPSSDWCVSSLYDVTGRA